MAGGVAQALGLGGITVGSRVGQPLIAEIELLALGPGELEQVQARIASEQDFDWVGIPRTPFLDQLVLSPAQSRTGTPVIRLTSRQPVRTGHLLFLVEVRAPSGRLLREVDLELPPPLAGAARVVEEPQAPAPVLPSRQETTTGKSKAGDGAGRTAAAPRPPAQPAREKAPVTPVEPGARTDYVTEDGDRLYSIARRYQTQAGMNYMRLAQAIFETNPRAFMGGDINRLRTGVTLRIPVDPSISPPSPAAEEPSAETAPDGTGDQAQDEGAAATSGETGENGTDATQEAGEEGEEKTAGTDDEAVEPDKGLEILAADGRSAPEGALTIASSQYIENLERSVSLARELAESRRQELESLKDAMGKLEGVIEKQERLIKLQNEQMAALQAAPREPEEKPVVSNRFLYMMMGVMGLSVVAILVLIVLLWRTRRRPPPAAAQSTDGDEEGEV